jgi:hypothetical protein
VAGEHHIRAVFPRLKDLHLYLDEKAPKEECTMNIKQLAVATLAAGLTGLGVMSMSATAVGAPVTVVDESTGVRYMSGGISAEDQARLEQAAGDFNLRVTFARPDGAYLADIPVVIEDAHVNFILRATSQGPLFYAELRPGRYTVMIPQPGEPSFTFPVRVPRYGQQNLLIHEQDEQEVLVEKPPVPKEIVVQPPTVTREIVVQKPAGAAQSCTYSSAVYSDGSLSCHNGFQYRCDDGAWDSLGQSC